MNTVDVNHRRDQQLQGAERTWLDMKSKSLGKLATAPRSDASEEALLQQGSAPVKIAPLVFSLKHIMVPIDFSECSLCALNYALALAKKLEADLVLLHIVEPAVYIDNAENNLLAPTLPDETNQQLMTASRERLMALKEEVARCGIAVETLVRMGRAQSEIPDTAKATGVDLIVMGTHGHSGIKHALLGGIAERVVRHSSCPVLVVRQP